MTLRLGNLELHLSFFFFLLVGLFVLWVPDIGVVFWAAVAIHEGGHLLVIRCLGLPVAAVNLTPVTIGIRLGEKARMTPGRELAMTLAGPFANLLAAFLLCLPGNMTALRLSAVNLALGMFHLLPLSGLDGGTAAEILLELALGSTRGQAAAKALYFTVALLGAALCLRSLWVGGITLQGALLLAICLCYFIPR